MNNMIAPGLDNNTLQSTSSNAWQNIKNRLRKEYGEATYGSWLSGLEFAESQGSRIILTAPTRFVREWILANYLTNIVAQWKKEDAAVQVVDIFIRSATAPQTNTQHAPQASNVTSNNISEEKVLDFTARHLEDKLSSPLDPRFTFEQFVTGDSNELAFAAARSIAKSEEVVQGCNPLFLYGGVGLGKTHLLHAIAWELRATQPDRKVVFLSAEKFMYQFIRALRANDLMSFKEQFRAIDVLLIDDIQFISGKQSTLEEFFHTFNTLIDNNRQVVISCDRSPSDLEGMGERARSRLGWGLVADVENSDYNLRLGVLHKKAERLHADVPEAVFDFIARKITSNIREMEGALNKVIAHSNLMNKPITMEGTKRILKDLLRSHDRNITVSGIQKAVSEYFGISMSELKSARRARNIARPRQIAMFLCKQLTTRSLIEIGQSFGGKDHTTVMHAVKKVQELNGNDPEVRASVEELMQSLQNV